jgi:hypothetical protein
MTEYLSKGIKIDKPVSNANDQNQQSQQTQEYTVEIQMSPQMSNSMQQLKQFCSENSLFTLVLGVVAVGAIIGINSVSNTRTTMTGGAIQIKRNSIMIKSESGASLFINNGDVNMSGGRNDSNYFMLAQTQKEFEDQQYSNRNAGTHQGNIDTATVNQILDGAGFYDIQFGLRSAFTKTVVIKNVSYTVRMAVQDKIRVVSIEE